MLPAVAATEAVGSQPGNPPATTFFDFFLTTIGGFEAADLGVGGFSPLELSPLGSFPLFNTSFACEDGFSAKVGDGGFFMDLVASGAAEKRLMASWRTGLPSILELHIML